MTPDALVEELKKRRVSLTAHGDEIKFSAPKGAVDAVLRRAMQANKQALFAYARATDAPHVAARPSKKFSLSVPRPALAPLIDPDWRPNHPFLQWVERDKGYLLDQLQIAKVFERAEGAHMWTSEGAQILDCLSQYGSLPFGHNPPEIWDALEECRASGRPAFSANGLSDAAGALAARLIGLWPEAGFDGVVFTNSGAESLEAAIKLARAATGRAALLSAKGGFHGLTIGALGVAGSDSYREGFAVPVDPRDRVPYGDVEALEAAFEAEPRRFAALMLEPLQGEAGIIDPPAGYLARARELCDAHGTLLVLDEVQSGLGRTGEMFASQYHGVIPDIMTLAKALGGGVMPVGATLYNARARSEAFGLRHSSTFAGGALAASAGLAALDYLTEDNCALLAHVRKTGAFLRARLEALQSRFPDFITGLSGRGMMQGIRLDFASLHEKPGLLGLVTQQNLTIHLVVSHLLNKGGVRLAPSFSAGDVLRIQPPLTVREDELEPLFAALEATLGALRAGDTGEVLAHLIGVEDRAPSEAKPPVTGPRPTIEARPAQAGEGRFAFVVHPLDIADFARLDPGLGGVEHGKLAGLVDRLSHFIDPFPIERLEIAGSGGARAYGELILVPHTPDVLMRMPAAKAEEEFGLAVDVAHERGARVVGLGGFSSIVTRGGMGLIAPKRPSLTSGNAYTSIIAAQAIEAGMARRGQALAQTRVAILGAAGMVGRATALLAAQKAGHIALVGNPNRVEAVRERGLAVAVELVRGMRAFAALEAPAPGSVASALSTMAELSDAAAAIALEEAGRIAIAPPLTQATKAAHAIILATNSTERFLTPAHVRQGALVCDVSRPFNVHPDVITERPDVEVIEGGLVKPREGLKGPTLAGPDDTHIFACAAETMLWSLEGAYARVHPLGCMEPARLLELSRIGQKHGFDLAMVPMIEE